jgi:uncharacterized membrane protein HdeD (DUF308 family)
MMNLTKNWWLIVLRGVLAILFGLAAFMMPSLAWLALIVLFGTYAILDGVFAMMSGLISSKYSPRWWVFFLEGLVSLAAGVIAVLRPDLATAVFIGIIAAWAILTGILEIVAAIRLRREIRNEWMLAFGGFVSLAFGILVFFQPETAGLVITLMIGAYALIFGVLLVVLGLRLKKWNLPTGEQDALRATRS